MLTAVFIGILIKRTEMADSIAAGMDTIIIRVRDRDVYLIKANFYRAIEVVAIRALLLAQPYCLL